MPPNQRSSVTRAIRSRDRGLRTVSILTRGLVAVSVGAAGLFSAMAAWAQPGRSKTHTSAAARSTGNASTPAPQSVNPTPQTLPAQSETGDDGGGQLGGDGNGGDDGGAVLAPPATLPDPGYQNPPPAQIPTYQYSPPPVVSGAT